jgi:HD-like signal output (HDOD) protein
MIAVSYDDLLASDKIPSPPVIVSKILRLADDPDSSLRDFSDLVRCDVGLTAQLIKIANSAYYSLRHPVADIDRAINIIGLSALVPLVVSFSMKGLLETEASPLDLDPFWERSVLLSSVSTFLSSYADGVSREEALLAGLLQDFGVLIISSVYPDEYLITENILSRDHNYLIAQERASFGFNHSVIGSSLLASWGFPMSITDAILCSHNTPLVDDRGLAWCVSGSNFFANQIFRGLEDGELLHGIYHSLSQPWINPLVDLDSATTELLEIISETSHIFDVQIISDDDVPPALI